ncbi:MAG: hypothetical protein ACO2PN_24515 [Pyrobaculum sp.]
MFPAEKRVASGRERLVARCGGFILMVADLLRPVVGALALSAGRRRRGCGEG